MSDSEKSISYYADLGRYFELWVRRNEILGNYKSVQRRLRRYIGGADISVLATPGQRELIDIPAVQALTAEAEMFNVHLASVESSLNELAPKVGLPAANRYMTNAALLENILCAMAAPGNAQKVRE